VADQLVKAAIAYLELLHRLAEDILVIGTVQLWPNLVDQEAVAETHPPTVVVQDVLAD
jgi:hypothetical protein